MIKSKSKVCIEQWWVQSKYGNLAGSGFFIFRSSHPEVFLGKVVLKICNEFTGEHTCQSAISTKKLLNHTSECAFSCKFASYIQNTFSSRTPLEGCYCFTDHKLALSSTLILNTLLRPKKVVLFPEIGRLKMFFII